MSKIGKENADRAVDLFRKGFNCSQAVFATYGPGLGLDEDTCLRVACAFGGGMGRMQHACGAVTGAFMAIGLRFGKGVGDDEDRKSRTYDLVRAMARRFEEKHGSIICRSLLGCDITTETGLIRAREAGLFQDRCEAYVRDAAIILDELLDV